MYIYMNIMVIPKMSQYSISEARTNLPGLIREAELGKDIHLTRRGQSVAVIIGRQKFDRIRSGYRSFSESYQEFLSDCNLQELNIDVDTLFLQSRDKSSGRDVSL